MIVFAMDTKHLNHTFILHSSSIHKYNNAYHILLLYRFLAVAAQRQIQPDGMGLNGVQPDTNQCSQTHS